MRNLYERIADEVGGPVLEFLEQGGAGMTAEYFADAFGYKMAAARRILVELERRGRIAKVHTVYFAVAS